MNRRPEKIQVLSPFQKIYNNWQLVTQIESSLNLYLTNARIITHSSIEQDSQTLGKNGLEDLIAVVKKMALYVEVMKSQHSSIECIRANAAVTQQKLEQHEEIIRNHQRKFAERTKAMVEENRILKETNQKIKRTYLQNQQALRQSLEGARKELLILKEDLNRLENEKKHLLSVISQFQEDSIVKDETVSRLQRITDHRLPTLKEKITELIEIKVERKSKPLYFPLPAQIQGPCLQKLGISDLDALSKLLSFLTPPQILSLASVSKRMRFLSSTQPWTRSLGKSIIAIKNKRIGYYHKHIDYFQKLCHKIPEEVLQMTYFRYHILKESAGQQIIQALNASSLIFQGRFEGEELYNGLPDYDKQIPNKLTFEASILEVDLNIVEDFKEDRSQERDQLIKLFQEMYGKIRTTYELYRADEESSSLFISNTLKHISRVFVLAKSLYLQVQNLQQLNSFLLSELNKWDRMEIDKGLQLEDLRAELEAEKKLKVFFTDKSIKSQQKALLEENLKLTFQMKFNKLNDLMNLTCAQKDEIAKKLESLTKANEKISTEFRDLRRAYESIKEKYNHVVEELVVVKETIIKMNII